MKVSCNKLAVMLFLLPSFTLTAQPSNYITRSKFYVGMNAGAGLLNLSMNTQSQQKYPFALDFYGGIMPFRWLRTGISIGGWLIEPYGDYEDNPWKGISIENIYAQIQVFPFDSFDLFLNFAGGFSNYLNMHPGAYNAQGTGFLSGLGYERRLFGKMGISLMINYGFGSFNDLNYTGISVNNQHYGITEFIIGFTWHFMPKKKLQIKKEKMRSLEE